MHHLRRLRGAWFSYREKLARDAEEIDGAGLCVRILDACHSSQKEFVADLGLKVCALVGRGGGKTTGGRARLLRCMLSVRKAKCLFIATTRGQAEKLMWGPLKDLLENLEIPAKFNETKLICTLLHNGSELTLVGADDKREIEKLRGLPFHEVGIDECASYPVELLRNLIERIIEPRLGDYNGCLWLIGTPGHILSGLFYDCTRPYSDQHRKYSDRDLPEHKDSDLWSFHQWTLEDGAKEVPAMARLWARALRNKKANGYSDDSPIWRREYLGFWAADNTENVYKFRPHLDDGLPWNQWEPKRNRLGFAIMPEEFTDWSYSYGMDMGHSDPFALEIFAWSPQDPKKTLYHVFEFNKKGMYAKTICELLLGEGLNSKTPDGCIGHTGWPDALVADIAGMGGGVLDEMGEVYGVRALPSEKKNKHDAIELFNGDMIDGRIKILKDSVLAEQLMSLQWDVDDYGRLRENKGMRNDACDAAVYARRAASHLLAGEPATPRGPYFPERADSMAIPDSDSYDDDDFSDMLDDGDYSHF